MSMHPCKAPPLVRPPAFDHLEEAQMELADAKRRAYNAIADQRPDWAIKALKNGDFEVVEVGGCAPAVAATILTTDSAERKNIPLTSGVLDYFPAALAEVAHVSYIGNEKHNPGEALHHARGKSMDHADCIARHLVERGTFDRVELKDGRVFYVLHEAYVAWRALALLQEALEARGAPLARGARNPTKEAA
jgi:hypothetical protein